MVFDPLLMIMQPRHIDEAIVSLKNIDIPKVWFRAYTEPQVMVQMNQYIKETNHSHYIVMSDDGIFRDHVSIHASTTDGLTKIGNCVIILNKAYIAHDCVVEDGVTLSCGVQIGGHVHVMKESNLGMGAAVHQYQVIGSWSMIGMGGVVPKKSRIEPGHTWVGNPARRLKTNMYALDKLNVDDYMLVEETARWSELIKEHGL